MLDGIPVGTSEVFTEWEDGKEQAVTILKRPSSILITIAGYGNSAIMVKLFDDGTWEEL